MSYHLEGRLLEVCNCNVLCPCWIGEDPDNGTCDTIVAWRIDKGTVDGVDVGGNTIAAVAHVPGNILEGNWTAAIFVDESASQGAGRGAAQGLHRPGRRAGGRPRQADRQGGVGGARTDPLHRGGRQGRARDRQGLLRRTGALSRRNGRPDHAVRHRVLDRAGRAGVRRQGTELSLEERRRSASISTSRTTTRCKAPSSSTHELHCGRRAGESVAGRRLPSSARVRPVAGGAGRARVAGAVGLGAQPLRTLPRTRRLDGLGAGGLPVPRRAGGRRGRARAALRRWRGSS